MNAQALHPPAFPLFPSRNRHVGGSTRLPGTQLRHHQHHSWRAGQGPASPTDTTSVGCYNTQTAAAVVLLHGHQQLKLQAIHSCNCPSCCKASSGKERVLKPPACVACPWSAVSRGREWQPACCWLPWGSWPPWGCLCCCLPQQLRAWHPGCQGSRTGSSTAAEASAQCCWPGQAGNAARIVMGMV